MCKVRQAKLVVLCYDRSMFRTRDFILFFVAVVFLSMAIGVTLFNQIDKTSVAPEVQFAQIDEVEYTAEVYVPESVSRSERLAEMRRKIADSEDVSISAPETIVDLALETDIDDAFLTLDSVPVLLQCSNYSIYSGFWPKAGLQFAESEGARILFLEKMSEPLSLAATSSSEVYSYSSRDVVLQLPMYSSPAAKTTCLSYDVIGVAKDGSLIRNNEAGLYGIFDSETMIGYALDGFPIYGKSDESFDNCGGGVFSGQYRYHLSDTRSDVLNCFASTPVAL